MRKYEFATYKPKDGQLIHWKNEELERFTTRAVVDVMQLLSDRGWQIVHVSEKYYIWLQREVLEGDGVARSEPSEDDGVQLASEVAGSGGRVAAGGQGERGVE